MNDKDFEDIIVVAMASSMQSDLPDVFTEALRQRAPLALLIDTLITERPRINSREWLSAIAALNQGRLEDLNVPRFRSYVIAKTGMSESALDKCGRELDTFKRLLDAKNQPIAMAARGDDLGGEQIAASEFLERLAESDEE